MVLFWNQSTETLKPTSNWLTKILLKMDVKMLCGAVCYVTLTVCCICLTKWLPMQSSALTQGTWLRCQVTICNEPLIDKNISWTMQSLISNTNSYLDANGFEELGMSQWKLDHLFDLCQLLTTSTNVVVTHLVQCILLLLTSQAHTLKPPHYWHILHITQHLTWAGATVLMLNIRETVFSGIKIL